MKDSLGREIDYLRISVTDRCNLRCKYCMPAEGVENIGHDKMLSFEDIVRIVRAGAGLGIRKIRLTGGEPLVRKGIVGLVRDISATPGIQEVVMTTNGTLIADYAADLKEAGLKRVNISIDTLDPEKYSDITRGGDLSKVADGLAAVEAVGLLPMKWNVVAMKGFNDDEILSFAQLTLSEPMDVRFIELMPIGHADAGDYGYMPGEEIRRILSTAKEEPYDGGVARYYRYPNAPGRIGIISPISCKFCDQCNKIRLTADGKLKTCLHSNQEIDLNPVLRTGDDKALADKLAQAILSKESRHHIEEGITTERDMNQIGG